MVSEGEGGGEGQGQRTGWCRRGREEARVKASAPDGVGRLGARDSGGAGGGEALHLVDENEHQAVLVLHQLLVMAATVKQPVATP
jgi:hypothetical protein